MAETREQRLERVLAEMTRQRDELLQKLLTFRLWQSRAADDLESQAERMRHQLTDIEESLAPRERPGKLSESCPARGRRGLHEAYVRGAADGGVLWLCRACGANGDKPPSAPRT